MAFLFEVKINYGVGFAMPLSVGFGLLYLTLLTLQFSFATLAIKSSTIKIYIPQLGGQAHFELTIDLNEQLPADVFGILYSFTFHSWFTFER